MKKKHVVAVLAFDRISPFHLSVPCAVFGESHPGAPEFELMVCAIGAQTICTSAGFSVKVQHGAQALAAADTVIVPSWRDPAERPPKALLDALIMAHKRGAVLVGLCLGAYVLAEAGLLDGLTATTHWEYAQDFAVRYPKVTVDEAVLYVDQGDVLTSAGTAAGLDCCLHLLRRQYGAVTANSVARRLVVPPHRQGGQAQFIEQPLPQTLRAERLAELIATVRSSLDAPHTLDRLAEKALMSRRTFSRQFRQLTGTTLGDWLLRERLYFAQSLLETTDHSMEKIALLTGFASPMLLRHHFRRVFLVTPSAWRKTFSGP